MKVRNKVALLTLSAVLIVIATAFTTLAYLTMEATITHTFTVGDVNAQITTTSDADVTLGDSTLVQNGEIVKLIPNAEYYLPVDIQMTPDSEDAWVFVQIINPIAGIEAPTGTPMDTDMSAIFEDGNYMTIHDQMLAHSWVPLEIDGALTEGVYYFDEAPDDDVSGHTVGAGWTLDLYDCFKVNCLAVKGTIEENNAEITEETPEGEEPVLLTPEEEVLCLGEYKDTRIYSIVYIVQADGISSAKDAWTVFADKYERNLEKYTANTEPETEAEETVDA